MTSEIIICQAPEEKITKYQNYAGNEMDVVIELPYGVFVVPLTAMKN